MSISIVNVEQKSEVTDALGVKIHHIEGDNVYIKTTGSGVMRFEVSVNMVEPKYLLSDSIDYFINLLKKEHIIELPSSVSISKMDEIVSELKEKNVLCGWCIKEGNKRFIWKNKVKMENVTHCG